MESSHIKRINLLVSNNPNPRRILWSRAKVGKLPGTYKNGIWLESRTSSLQLEIHISNYYPPNSFQFSPSYWALFLEKVRRKHRRIEKVKRRKCYSLSLTTTGRRGAFSSFQISVQERSSKSSLHWRTRESTPLLIRFLSPSH